MAVELAWDLLARFVDDFLIRSLPDLRAALPRRIACACGFGRSVELSADLRSESSRWTAGGLSTLEQLLIPCSIDECAASVVQEVARCAGVEVAVGAPPHLRKPRAYAR